MPATCGRWRPLRCGDGPEVGCTKSSLLPDIVGEDIFVLSFRALRVDAVAKAPAGGAAGGIGR